jgi:hypothetical protein
MYAKPTAACWDVEADTCSLFASFSRPLSVFFFIRDQYIEKSQKQAFDIQRIRPHF